MINIKAFITSKENLHFISSFIGIFFVNLEVWPNTGISEASFYQYKKIYYLKSNPCFSVQFFFINVQNNLKAKF